MKKSVLAILLVSVMTTGACGAVSTVNKVKDLASGKTAKEIEDFTKKAEAAKNLTYTAEYTSKASSKEEKLRIVQKPPKSLYAQGDSLLIDDGKRTITCSPEGSDNNKKMQCLDVGPAGTNPGTFTQIFSAPALLAGLTALTIIPGVKVTHPTRNLAGESLDCVKIEVTKDNKHVESCVTKDGVLGYYDTGDGDTFSLTSFKRSASDSDFTPPVKPQTTDEIARQATSTTEERTTSTTEGTTSTTEGTTTTESSDTTTTSG